MLTYAIIFCLIFQCAVAIYLLGTTKKIEAFDNQLRKLLLIILIHLSTKFLLLNFIGNTFSFAKAATGFTFFYGPFLLIMTYQVIQKPFAKKIVYVQLTPFIAGLLIYLFINLLGYTGHTEGHKIAIYNNLYQGFAILSIISYSVLVKINLKRNEGGSSQLIVQQKQLLAGIATVWIVGIISGLIVKSLHIAGSFLNWLDIKVILYTNLLMIPVLAIRYKLRSSQNSELSPAITLPEVSKLEPVVSVVEAPKKYQKSGIDENLFALYEEKILKHMKKNKPYLKADLSLEEFAKQLAIPKHHITQTLNDKLERSFYQFINEYRIEEAIFRLKKNTDDLNLLSLAFEVGFNSKSSFNTYFKKITGHTPSSYKKTILSIGEKL